MPADFFTWTSKGSIARMAIESFLSEAADRVQDKPECIPMRAREANLAINWLRGLLDLKPSEMSNRKRLKGE